MSHMFARNPVDSTSSTSSTTAITGAQSAFSRLDPAVRNPLQYARMGYAHLTKVLAETGLRR